MPEQETARHLRLVYIALGLCLVLLPLSLHKPGVPGGLKADEGAYLMMASSLAFDFDLELDAADSQRLFDEYPLRWVNNVIVFGADEGRTVYYGKPFVYPLFGAPFVRLFGSNGLLCLNLLMLWAMVGMGWRVLAEHGASTVALAFSIGFFCFSAGWSYAFWMQPEVFNMFFVLLAMFLGFRWRSAATPSAFQLFLSGAALALPVYNKPMLLALLLPLLLPIALEQQPWPKRVRLAAWLGAGLAAVGLLAVAASSLLIGHASAYGVSGRQGVRICGPEDVPELATAASSSRESQAAGAMGSSGAAGPAASLATTQPAAAAEAAAPPVRELQESPENRSFYWLLRIPEFEPSRWLENAGYFLWGRHTGLIHYFPFAALALLLFAVQRQRGAQRWALLAAIAAYAGYFLLYIGWNWQGGGGFVGNRYFVNLVPAMIFLVPTLRPAWALVPTFAWAGLVIGPLLLTPLGLTVPEPTLQAHTRNWPLNSFPHELTLRNVPGYHSENLGGLRVIVRADRALARGGSYVVAARATTSLLLVSPQPLERLTVQVVGLAPATAVDLSLGRDWQSLELAKDEGRTVELEAGRAKRRNGVTGKQQYVYELEVHSDRGVLYPWTRFFPPWPCAEFTFDRSVQETFYAGAEIRILGPSSELQRDLYQVAWNAVEAPSQVSAGSRFEVAVSLTNASRESWSLTGAARIGLSSHWLDESGEAVVFDGLRARVPPLGPGEQASLKLPVVAPRLPGSYQLEVDLVREYVSWFAERNGGQTHRIPIEVSQASEARPERSGAGPPTDQNEDGSP